MRDAKADAERAKRELSEMGMEHVRVDPGLDDGAGQPAISAHWRVSRAENDLEPRATLAEAERVARILDGVLPGYRSGPAYIIGAEGIVQVSVGYE